jgi:hypothetical protein
MDVVFRRTGERRYAVVLRRGAAEQVMSPAPGFDEDIPHDLVHYVVEAELGLESGVFGRAARGGGTFRSISEAGDARERARARRKQARREQTLGRAPENDAQMRESERLAYHADIAFRRRRGQRPAPHLWQVTEPLSREDGERLERIVTRLERIAPRWRALPIDGELAFAWPSPTPK